jgi:hypothetical protein
MDYGMKHILGNLREQSYEEIIGGEEMQRVKRAVNGDSDIDVLCRECTSATEVDDSDRVLAEVNGKNL